MFSFEASACAGGTIVRANFWNSPRGGTMDDMMLDIVETTLPTTGIALAAAVTIF
jgi:hypothetical protein